MEKGSATVRTLGHLLRANKLAQTAELLVVFAVALVAITVVIPLAGENPLARQSVVWVTNIIMLGIVWQGLRLRGQNWEHFGLSLRFAGWRTAARTLLKSFAVFAAAVAAFILGSIIMANIIGTPERADM